MKKIPVLLLLSMFAVSSFCGCGSETTDVSDAAMPDVSSQEVQTDVSAESQVTDDDADAVSSGAEYLTYDDLPDEETMWVDTDYCMVVNMPTSCESYGSGLSTYRYTSVDYYYVVACGTEAMPGADLEETFLEFLNRETDDGYLSNINMISRGTYEEMIPEMEYVTLDTGAEAIRFNGILHKDEYGTLYDCVIYGYATMCDDIPVIVSYLIEDEELIDEATQSEMGRFVDEIINTVHLREL